jgi:hypothetical protein
MHREASSVASITREKCGMIAAQNEQDVLFGAIGDSFYQPV